MNVLIMSCSTGGGHNSAGIAVMEELKKRGHNVTFMDPYDLAGKNVSKNVGNTYIKIAGKTPKLFGFIYFLGDAYRRLPIKSPVYAVNKIMQNKMKELLENNRYDVIVMPHLYPGEILTSLKNNGVKIPKTVFVATDYVCIPFTEEIDCDYYITPCKELNGDFIRRGIDKNKLVPLGIPVKRAFCESVSRSEAIKNLGLDTAKRYVLVSGGSFGAGNMDKTVKALLGFLKADENRNLIVLCGNNEKLFEKFSKKYSKHKQIMFLKSTNKIAMYMRACDAYISKPGGLSSTEAAVTGTPLIHISPIPGCETKNMEFFARKKMSIDVGNHLEKLPEALDALGDRDFVTKMTEKQKSVINPRSAIDICNFLEKITE